MAHPCGKFLDVTKPPSVVLDQHLRTLLMTMKLHEARYKVLGQPNGDTFTRFSPSPETLLYNGFTLWV